MYVPEVSVCVNQGVVDTVRRCAVPIGEGGRHHRPPGSLRPWDEESSLQNSSVQVPVNNDSGQDPITGVSVTAVTEQNFTGVTHTGHSWNTRVPSETDRSG